MIDKFKRFYINHKKFFLYGLIALIVLVIFHILYILERYIIYNIIYHLLNLFPINIFSIKFGSIILIIYFHLIFARLIILSLIFPQGGFLKKIIVYDEFDSYITLIIGYILKSNKAINSNNFTDLEKNIKQLNEIMINDRIKNLNYFDQNILDITKLYENYKKNKEKDNKIKLNQSLKKFCSELEKICDFSFPEILFKFKYKESLILMENYMLNYFSTHIVEKINISTNFDIYLLSPKEFSENSNILTIFCNQNGMCCEIYPFYTDNIYYYLNQLNCSIILWNYTGFGLRKGITTFYSINKDVDILSKFIKNKFNKYNIIIHGCSIGGYSSIILAQKLSELNTVLISDRTFGDIKDIVKTYNYNKILLVIYSIIFPKWYFKYRNIENYINIPIDKKIILFDANDDVIPYEPSSLVFSLTQKYYDDIVKPFLFKCKNYYLMIMNNCNEILKEINNIFLEEKFQDENSNILLKKLYKNIKSNTFEKFLMFFMIFSFPFNKYKEIYIDSKKFNDNYTNIPRIIKNIIEKNKNIFSDKLIEFISILNFLFIKFNLISDLKEENILKFNYDDNDNKLFSMEKEHINGLKKYFGFIHRISCGHEGKLMNEDFNVILKFLEKNKLLSNINY